MGQTKLLEKDQEEDLAVRISRGDDEAFDHLVRANLRLVVSIARRYASLSLLVIGDLVAEGNLGLMVAAKRFDPALGARFSTYATFWIKNHMRRALANHGRTIRLPIHQIDILLEMFRKIEAFSHDTGREPTDRELALAMGLPLEKIFLLRAMASSPTSLDAPVGQDENTFTLADLLPDENVSSPCAELHAQDELGTVKKLMLELPDRLQEVLCRRYGLRGYGVQSLAQAATAMGVSNERIRQLEERAIRKMRAKMFVSDSSLPLPQSGCTRSRSP